MEVRFEDDDLSLLETDDRHARGRSPAVVRAFRKRIQFIRDARDERDLYAIGSVRFEKLRGDREGQHSMRLNDQWRLIVRLEEEERQDKVVVVIGIEDYH